MEENTPSKVGTFLSSAMHKFISIIVVLLILGLAGIIVFFWNKNQLLEQKNEILQEQKDNFTEMNNQVRVEDVVVKKTIKDDVEGFDNIEVTTNNNSSVPLNSRNDISTQNNTIDNKVYFEVKELGIKFLMDKDFANKLTYKVISANSVNFSTKELNSIEGGTCDKKLVRITKIKGVANNDDSYEKPINMNYIKQFKNYYIQLEGPQISCSNNDERVLMDKNKKDYYYQQELEVSKKILDSMISITEL